MPMSSVRQRRTHQRETVRTKPEQQGDAGLAGCLPRSRLFVHLLLFHFLLACTTRTYFQPDEYWQSLEVAHRLVEGFGYLTWEWLPTKAGQSESAKFAQSRQLLESFYDEIKFGPIRSPVYPLIFVPIYTLLKTLGLASKSFFALSVTPRLVQAVAATFTAFSTYEVAEHFGQHTAAAATFSLLSSPFYLYTACRTFSNNLETTLTLGAVSQCCKTLRAADSTDRLTLSLILAATACLVRPTSGLIWPFFYGYACVHLLRIGRRRLAISLIQRATLIGIVALVTATAIDSAFYGRPTLTILSFFYQNVTTSVSQFYGSQPWHWYISQGLPVIGMTALPFMLSGAWRCWRAPQADTMGRLLVLTATWTLTIYSFALAHKEWRFLLPIVPLLHVFAGRALATSKVPNFAGSDIYWRSIWCSVNSGRRAILLCTLPFSIYLIAFHGAAQGTTLPRYLRQRVRSEQVKTVGFLMPCHSTPWQSYFHLPELEIPDPEHSNGSGDWGKMWFLTCEPPRLGESKDKYRDQSDFFYEDPLRYLQTYFPDQVDPRYPPSRGWRRDTDPSRFEERAERSDDPPHAWPSSLVVFQSLLAHDAYGKDVQSLLSAKGYVVVARLWNSLLHDDSRRRGRMVVFEHVDVTPKAAPDLASN